MRRLRNVLISLVAIAVLVGISALGGLAIGAMLTGTDGAPTQVARQDAASPSPSYGLKAVMPVAGDCNGCHSNGDGGIGTKPIPVIAHPLQGWSQCTECHREDRLVQTAPGHTGIHAQDCTVCHTQNRPPAPLRPHALTETGGCLTCHGRTESLPHAMETRSAELCWLCHQSTEDPSLEPVTPRT